MRAGTAVTYLAQLPPDEPVFILRARDPLAPVVIEQWCKGAEAMDVRSGKIADARMLAQDMAKWPTKEVPN